MDKIEIYTDGSCFPNPGVGGWAFIVVYNDKQIAAHSGFIMESTNNISEMMAELKALEWLIQIVNISSGVLIYGLPYGKIEDG